MILELDLGNTRGKWRIVAGAETVDRGVGEVAAWRSGDLPAWRGISRVRIASVLGEAAESELAAALGVLGVPVEFARSTQSCGGVTSAYAEPQRLGVDRWLAMLSAYREFRRAVLVVDAGSALTIDLIDASGRHQGGYIIPGARLMAEVLLRSTGRVRFESAHALRSTSPGEITDECVHNGIALALVGAVRLALVQARAAVGEVILVLAGGDAEDLSVLLVGEEIYLRPDLVLDGLRWTLP